MKKLFRLSQYWILFGMFSIVLGGCAPKYYEPRFIDPSFQTKGVQNIVVLPVIDHRRNKDLSMEDYNNTVRKILKAQLEKKKYNVEFSSNISSLSIITREDIVKATPSWVKSLGPPKDRWVLLIVVEILERRVAFGAEGRAQIVGYLYDKSTGELLWEGAGFGKVVLGVFLTALVDDAAIEEAALDLIRSFPVFNVSSG